MRHTMKLLSILIALFAVMPILIAGAIPTLSLDLNRDFGLGIGNDIAGRFTLKAEASSNTSYVEFYIDNQLQQNDTAAPYNWQFNTNNYTLGEHTLKAVAYDATGNQNKEITRNFVEDSTNNILLVTIVVAVVITTVAVAVAVYRIKKK